MSTHTAYLISAVCMVIATGVNWSQRARGRLAWAARISITAATVATLWRLLP